MKHESSTDLYLKMKKDAPETIVLILTGDFYESFHDDAETISKVLGLTLMTQNKGSENPIPMAGFPYHSLESYLQKLVKAGHRVSVCERDEGAKQ